MFAGFLVAKLYKEYLKMPETDGECGAKLKDFIENYEFRPVGAWDGGFHVYGSSKLSSKKRHSMSYSIVIVEQEKVLRLPSRNPGNWALAYGIRHFIDYCMIQYYIFFTHTCISELFC